VPVATNNPVEALNVKRFGAPPALTSKSSSTTAVGFGNPVNAMVGAEISPAVAVDPAKVIFHADVAAAVSGLRCVLNGAGAPAVVAVIVAVTPLGHAATVSSVNVPVIPPEFGRIRAFAVLARTFPTVLEDVGLGVGAGVATPPIGIGFVVPLAHPTTSADKRRDVVLVRTPNRIFTTPSLLGCAPHSSFGLSTKRFARTQARRAILASYAKHGIEDQPLVT
jgi:hypothetical protein